VQKLTTPVVTGPDRAPGARSGPAALMAPALSGATAIAVFGVAQMLAVGTLSVTALGRDALAFGVVAAFVTATAGALTVAILSRTRGLVCAPVTSIAVIYAALCADLVTRAGPQGSVAEVWATLSIAVIIMGLLQIVAGWLRVGEAIKFMPYPVSAGFLTGIGLQIIWSQVGPALGLQSKVSTYHWNEIWLAIKPGAVLVAIVAAGTAWTIPSLTKRVQPLLAALLTGTLAYHLIAGFGGPELVGPTLGAALPIEAVQKNLASLWGRRDAEWLLATSLHVLPYGAFLALQGIINAAVSSASLANVTGERPNVHRALVSQGIGNILCGCLAALPLGTSLSQSAVAGRMQNVSHLVPLLTPVLLLVVLPFFAGALAYIPVAALAGMLVTTGIGTIDRWARGLAERVLRGKRRDHRVVSNLVLVSAVAASFFFGGIPLALLVGAVLATVLLAINLSAVTTIDVHDTTRLSSTRVWPAEQAKWLASARGAVKVFRPRGGLFFGTADQLSSRLSALGAQTRYCVLDLSRLTTLDATGCQIVASGAKKLAAAGITTVLAGLDASNPRDRALVDIGLNQPDPKTHWFEDLDRALEWVEAELIRTQWPEASDEAPVPLSESPLARGLSADELDELTQHLTTAEHEAGPLFRRGDPGSVTYVIDRGAVEIRIDAHDGRAARLAAFGPGSIFGEIAMLASDARTADAVCMKRTRMYELTREALETLEARSPKLYARILENLNAHLANRLVIATGLVQAQR
jgi:SulP family sulfate permease